MVRFGAVIAAAGLAALVAAGAFAQSDRGGESHRMGAAAEERSSGEFTPTPVEEERPDLPDTGDEEIVLTVDGGAHALGAADAPVAIVEFSEYQCPFCAQHVIFTLPLLIANYVDTGKLRYVMRDFPLNRTHGAAFEAAMAARCAGDQGRFMDMHFELFAERRRLSRKDWAGHATAAGLEPVDFAACMSGLRHEDAVRQNIVEGLTFGVRGTPTFLVGLIEADGNTITPIFRLAGGQSYEDFAELIDAMIEGAADGG